MNNSLKKQIIESMAQLICDIDNKKDAHLFLFDFLGEKEYLKLAKKLTCGHWIYKNRDSGIIKNNLLLTDKEYSLIEGEYKKKGFNMAIRLIEAEEWANKWMDKIQKYKKIVRPSYISKKAVK